MGHHASDIQCIGLTNQRETTIAWDSLTGSPLYPAIVWSDTRTIDTVRSLSDTSDKGVNALQSICGLPLASSFSAVKMHWMVNNVPAVTEALKQSRLQFGTVDTWLIYHLTGGLEGGTIMTDATNASRTMLMDIHTLQWSHEALRFFGLENIKLPKIMSSSQAYGTVREGSLKNIQITGCLGDQQSALVGQKCFSVGDAKNTYGTGCFMLFNNGSSPVISKNGLLPTVAYQFGRDKPQYALEGSVAAGGSSIHWLRDNLGIVSDAEEVITLAAQVKDASGVYFVTAFAGLLAPYWCPEARGTICGMTQYTKREHLARATLESVCYQSRAILEAMDKASGTPLRSLKVDGGMSKSDLCMQIQADVLGIEVDRPDMCEASALGAAIAAGFAVGVWKSIKDLENINSKNGTLFSPRLAEGKRQKMYGGWQEAIKRSCSWLSSSA
ncbi:hypothetical protein BDF14DRAFT_1731526 [Spinellus fusiger]|nr:hypothetical protein BDF14DRAFT_1731526 [Spinellus fusiger]